jgi:hypothetical protein
MTGTKINAIMDELLKLDRAEIMNKVSAQLMHMIEHKSARDIAYVLAYSTAMYSIFDGVLNKLMEAQEVQNLISEIKQLIDEDTATHSAPKARDIN